MNTIPFQTLRENPEMCLELAREITRNHGIHESLTRVIGGSQLVFRTDARQILKIFNPTDHPFFTTETIFLRGLYGRLPVETPKLLASGLSGKFPYIIMTEIPGVLLETAWPQLSLLEKEGIVRELGDITRVLHGISTDNFPDLPFLWDDFIQGQLRDPLARHRSYGLAPEWLDQIEKFVQKTSVDYHNPSEMIPLHTELMHDHIFLTRENDRWHVSGLIDFEPSMIGHREYEFASVGLFITEGDPRLFSEFLLAYGYTPTVLTPEFRRRIMTFLLLHRYSHLTWFMSRIPSDVNPRTLEDLERFWFVFDYCPKKG